MQNVITSATGTNSLISLSASVSDILAYINTNDAAATLNTLGTYNTGNVVVRNDLNFSSGAGLLFEGVDWITSNSVNGVGGLLSVRVGAVEKARFTPAECTFTTPVGISVSPTLAHFDVGGTALIRGSLYISTMGAPLTSTLGNLYADGDLFATGVKYPSDPSLKQAIRPYDARGLPRAVEFVWRGSGARDVGVLADEVAEIEPACVQRGAGGTLSVDYPKLNVLLLAEVAELKTRLHALEQWREAQPGSPE
jgi:hypothetical protein